MKESIRIYFLIFLITLSSMFVHELGHAIACVICGCKVLRLDFGILKLNISNEYTSLPTDNSSFITHYVCPVIPKFDFLLIHLSGIIFQALYCILLWYLLFDRKKDKDILFSLILFCLICSIVDIKEALNILLS